MTPTSTATFHEERTGQITIIRMAMQVGEHIQLKRRGEVLCGKVADVRLDPDTGTEWFKVQTAIGRFSAPRDLVRQCGRVDGRCTCEVEA